MASTQSHVNPKLAKFLTAMQSIYGPFDTVSNSSLSDWTPPPMTEGHRGRYLWTDGFAVVNFLTLYRSTGDKKYLSLAKRLIHHVHSILGFTRDGRTRLPGATEEWPLKGGLRIGKIDESGDDGDGQYFHYLTVWMFALNRYTLITGEEWYNQQAITLAEAILPKFMVNWEVAWPRMFWKMSMDLSEPLVMREGNLDPIDGYVTYKLLQAASGDSKTLEMEIATLKKCVDTKWKDYTSSDTLDIGMTLWTAHWLQNDEQWASYLCQRALECLGKLKEKGYFTRPTSKRLAFREFGTALGVQCVDVRKSGLEGLADSICSQWEDAGLVPEPSREQEGRMAGLMPITAVMYATALIPGVMLQATGEGFSGTPVDTAA